MGSAEAEPVVHLGPQATIRGALPGQTAQGRVARFLTGVANRAEPTLERLRQADLLEVARWKSGGHRHRRIGPAVVAVMATA
jgi:hypothetical protein